MGLNFPGVLFSALSWVMPLSVPPAGGHALGDSRPTYSEFDFDENGHVIVKVTLHSLVKAGVTQTFRFMFDTGFYKTVLDNSISSDFFREYDSEMDVLTDDVSGEQLSIPPILIGKIGINGFIRTDIQALRMNLKQGPVGSLQDQPIDGIIGMSFLRGTRFVFKAAEGRIEWGGGWDAWAPRAQVPVHWSDDGRPYVQVRMGSHEEVSCLVDTGFPYGLELPANLRPSGELRPEVVTGLAGKGVATYLAKVPKVELGGWPIQDLEVEFPDGSREGCLGQGLWSAGPVGFDFIENQLILRPGGDGSIRMLGRRPRNLPLRWERRGQRQALKVKELAPGSALAEAGLREGDELLRIGAAQAEGPSRRAAMASLRGGRPALWLIRRADRELLLRIPRVRALPVKRDPLGGKRSGPKGGGAIAGT